MKNFIIKNKKMILTVISILFILICVEIMAVVKSNNLVFPHLTDIFKSLINILSSWASYKALLFLILKICISLVVSFVLSLLLVYLVNVNENIEYLIKPIVVIFKGIPMIIFILFLWLLVDKNVAPYIISVVASLPILYEGLLNSTLKSDSDSIKASSLETSSKSKQFFKIRLPIALPFIIMSLLQSFGIVLKTTILSEYIFQNKETVGKFIKNAYDFTDMSSLIAWALIILLITLIIDFVLSKINKNIIKKDSI